MQKSRWDASGRLIKQSHLSLSPGAQEVSIEMQDLADGVYVVTFESGTNYKVSRLIRKQ
ncbi:MAG: T9SS type A sorting domain-containing protein [Bacteroidota bacterium]|nr:MAG: T9SS type A sorting domain-containing protein [Bacteroidota bacterium]